MNSFTHKSSFSYEELIECGKSNIFGPGNAQLPAPPMLMFNRITQVSTTGGKFEKGEIVAEMDVNPELWFFKCHFLGDPIMPGCLGLDALWQMLGFYLGWLGYPGRGRALGVGEIKFVEEVKPDKKLITYSYSLLYMAHEPLYNSHIASCINLMVSIIPHIASCINHLVPIYNSPSFMYK